MIAASLEGTWREEHLFALEQAMQRYDFLEQQIEDCEAQIAAQIDRSDAARRILRPDSSSGARLEDALSGTVRQEVCMTGDRALTMALHRDDGRRPHRDPDHRSPEPS